MKHLIFLALGFISACAVFDNNKSENFQTLFTIDQDSVSVDEFIYAFQKNRPADSAVFKSEVDEYLELYKNFKLKVAEARSIGMDTTSEFNKEYATYMNQLDNSYLQSSNDVDSLVREAYRRLQRQINASHILIEVKESAPAKDTLKAYNKLMSVRDSIVNHGAGFGDLASIYSEDPSAKQNKGSLGYFSVFQMVYSFESAAYSTKVGEVSEPFRTRFGYHILKVNEKRENEGRIRVAHIMIRPSSTAEAKALDIYNQLNAGQDWNQLCSTNSQDSQSAARGGELAPFSRGQIVKPFSDAAFGLTEPDEITEPIQTQYGWHIIKLIERLPIDDFDKMQQQLQAQVRRDDRSKISEQKMLDKLAIENSLIESEENIQLIIDPVNHNFENSVFTFANDSLRGLLLFTLNDLRFTSDSLYNYIGKRSRKQNTREFLFDQYKAFKEATLINYEKAHLAKKYPEYKYLKQEYHDGILLFSIMEDKVWNPASSDSVGIANYYETNKGNYMDSTTVEIAIFTAPDRAIIDSTKSSIPSKEVFFSLSRSEKDALTNQNNDTAKVSLHLELGEFTISEQPILSKSGIPDEPIVQQDGDLWYYLLPLRQPEEPRLLSSIRGRLIADYQGDLENEWLKELSEKHLINVNESGLKIVYNKLDTK